MRRLGLLVCAWALACASARPAREGTPSDGAGREWVHECDERTVVALCRADQCELYECRAVAPHLATSQQSASLGRIALPGALLPRLVPEARCAPSPTFFNRGGTDVPPSSRPETPTPPPPRVFGDRDVMEHLIRLRKPWDVAAWWASEPKAHPEQWMHPLSHWESAYIQAMHAPSVPEPLRMRPSVDPAHLTDEEALEAQRLSGRGEGAAQAYAHLENRRRIVAHYVLTHPATIRLHLTLYSLVRDTNPLHFALERGWQVGRGQEMFTEAQVSQLGAATEFFTALAVGVAVDRAARLALAPSPAPNPLAFMTPEVERAFVEAVRIRAANLRLVLGKKRRGAVFAGVLDTRTGRTFFARNRTKHDPPVTLHPILAKSLEAYKARTQGGTPQHLGTPGDHAEVIALSKALDAREAMMGRPITPEELSEFIVHNRALENWSEKPGIPPPCVNCQAIIPADTWFSP